MPFSCFHSPVIVMGMAQCGTTLLAEMVHRGGTPMFSGEADPSYDAGIKYERRSAERVNRQILGVTPEAPYPLTFRRLWERSLSPFPQHEIAALHQEVGDTPWGLKDPRTTLTYRVWLEAFPTGPRLYSYRCHREYLLRSVRAQKKFKPLRARLHVQAWLAYNEILARNCALDDAANRPWALVRYEELMGCPALIPRIEAAVGIPLCEARNPALRRATVAGAKPLTLRERFFLWYGEAGRRNRVETVYQSLDALRLVP